MTDRTTRNEVDKFLKLEIIKVMHYRQAQRKYQTPTSWIAAAANVRMDVALRLLGQMEKYGAVRSLISSDHSCAEWRLA